MVGEGRGGRTVGHVHAPDSRAAAEIEDSLGVGDGREMEFIVEEEQEQLVCDVELVVLHLVVWAPIFTLAEFVVAAPIFVAVFPDNRWDGCGVAQVIVVTKCRVRFIKVASLQKISAREIISSIDIYVAVCSNTSSIGDKHGRIAKILTGWIGAWMGAGSASIVVGGPAPIVGIGAASAGPWS